MAQGPQRCASLGAAPTLSAGLLQVAQNRTLGRAAAPLLLRDAGECGTWPCWPLEAGGGCCRDPFADNTVPVALALAIMATFLAGTWLLAGLAAGGGAKAPPPPLLRSLEGMRSIVDAWIIVGYTASPRLDPGGWLYWILNARGEGGTRAAVQAMFVVSGFLLERSAGDGQLDRRAGAAFVARRLARLCPGYFATYLLQLALLPLGRCSNCAPVAWPLHAAFLQSLHPVGLCGQEGVFAFLPWKLHWVSFSVSALLLVSLTFPLLHNVLPRDGALATAALVLLPVLRTGIAVFLCHLCPQWATALYVLPFLRLPDFATGLLAARLLRRAEASMPSCRQWGWALDGALLMVMGLIFLTPLGTEDRLGGDFLMALPVALLCALAGLAEVGGRGPDSGLLGRLLALEPLAAPGACSFVAYMLQFWAVDVLGSPAPWWAPTALAATVAWPLHRLMQKPWQSAVEQLLAGSEAAAALPEQPFASSEAAAALPPRAPSEVPPAG